MKTKIKILSVVLAILMVISIIPITVSAEKLTSGPCGYNLTWTFDESTGTLTISGTGEMYDDIHRYFPSWHGYISSIESVVISEGVTTIGDSTFYNHENIKNVSIADSVTDIGDEAFYNCKGLIDVIIGKGVTTIGYRAFYNCDGLTDVVIGKGVTVIDDYAFNACSNLKTVTIYNAVETIGEYSFNCPKLTDVYYFGTEAEWNAISKGSIIYGIITGTGLEKATIHFLGEETHECSYNAVVTAPTCTEQGYTTYTCVCGDSYIDDYVDALGHNYKNGVCDICGTGIKGDYLYINGVRQKAYQLVEFEGDFYYIGDRHEIVKNKKVYIKEERTNDLTFADGTPITAGWYEFDENGKMVIVNGIVGNKIYKNNTQLKAYQLVEVDGEFYYIGDRHEIVKNKKVYIKAERLNDLTYEDGTSIQAGFYTFDENGKMIILDGIVGNKVYKNNVQLKAYQLVEVNGDFYYIGDRHEIVKDKRVYVKAERTNDLTYANDTLIQAGWYNFDADGKLIIE